MKHEPSSERLQQARDMPKSSLPLLIVGSLEEDDSGRQQLLGCYAGQEQRVRSCGEARQLLYKTSVQVVICDKDLPDGSWRDILESTAALQDPPAVIVTSRLADDRLWLEVLNAGGYDVLAKPCDRQEARRTIALARRYNRGRAAA
jgi:DNA-binding response OmpR family regulator